MVLTFNNSRIAGVISASQTRYAFRRKRELCTGYPPLHPQCQRNLVDNLVVRAIPRQVYLFVTTLFHHTSTACISLLLFSCILEEGLVMSSLATPITPKSVLRYRPISTNTATDEPPCFVRASRPSPSLPTKRVASIHQRSRSQLLVLIVTGMLVTLTTISLAQLGAGWMQTKLNDLRYGYPRTFQIDAYVGGEPLGQPSHFEAINMRGRLEVIELPGGDPTHARIFQGPQLYGPNAALVPVTIRFVPDGHPRTPDMVIQCQGTQIVFHNVHGTFQTTPDV